MMAAVALALGSCSRTETVEVASSRAISFEGTGAYNTTKADVTSEDFKQFYVYGSYNAAGNIFDAQEVNKSGDSWGYTPLQYWVDGNWNFGAYYPKANGVVAEWAHESGLTLNINSDNSHQNDVVYADATAELTEGASATYATPVTLNFNHLLSKVQFKFVKGSDGNYSTAGQKVELSNFEFSGSMVTSGKWAKAIATNNSAQDASYTAFTEATEVTEEGLSATYYVIPQTVQSTWTITCNAKVTDNAGEVLKNGTISITAFPTSPVEWEAENAYVYTATIYLNNIDDPNVDDEDLKPITFEASAKDWTENSPETGVTLKGNE